MMPGENGPAPPELTRRATLSSCHHDPVRAVAPRADRTVWRRSYTRRTGG